MKKIPQSFKTGCKLDGHGCIPLWHSSAQTKETFSLLVAMDEGAKPHRGGVSACVHFISFCRQFPRSYSLAQGGAVTHLSHVS